MDGARASLAGPSDYLALLKPRVMSLVVFTSLAAMIAANGDATTAFEIAENISNTLLLPEEARLLTLAR